MPVNQKLNDVYIFHLERTIRQFKKYKQNLFSEKDIDLSSEQWVILKRISEEEGISQREVADTTFKDPASVTRTLDLLEKKDLVSRKPSPSDRRTMALFLTRRGDDLVKQLLPLAVEIRARGLEGISADDQKKLIELLEKVHDNFMER